MVVSKPSTVTVADTVVPLFVTNNETCAVVPVMVTTRSFAERTPPLVTGVNARDWAVKLF